MNFDPDAERRALQLMEQLLDVPDAEQDRWIVDHSGGDSNLTARLQAMLAAHRASVLRTGGALDQVEPVAMPARIGAYRVVGLIGRGGMGAVYRGERAVGDFEHSAAIKVIKPGLLSEALVARFQRERQTMALLEHPNIARLYDGGATEDGSPYIIMELVDGQPILEWAKAKALGLDARLRLFLDVCNAVGFAHRNLIVHRDITPSNVLVTRDGTPKLIDFGIARPALAGSGGGVRSPASLAGLSLTPGFAAPERMHGAEPATSADIYSLGRLLEALCAGLLNPELAAVANKAGAEAPDQRYPSVDAMADDLQRWRDGRSVPAYSTDGLYLARKFVRRNLRAVLAAALVLTLLVSALVVTALANAEAKRARAETERHFAETRRIAKTMMFDVYDAVSKVPGATNARLLLAETAQDYLDSLAADPTASLDVRLDAGEGYYRLARATGGTTGQTLGRLEEGKVLMARALAILEPLHRRHPDNEAVTRKLGAILHDSSREVLWGDGDSKAARPLVKRAQSLLAGVAQHDATSAGAWIGTYLTEGDCDGWDGEIARAGTVYERGLALAATLPPALRDSTEVQNILASLRRQNGSVFSYFGKPDQALGQLEAAMAIRRTLLAREPTDPVYQRNLQILMWSVGDVNRLAGKFEAGARASGEGLALARRTLAADPQDAGAKEMVAMMGRLHARLLSALGQHADAVALVRESLRFDRERQSRSGEVTTGALKLAVNLRESAEVLAAAGQVAEQCRYLGEAFAIFSGLEGTGKLNTFDRDNNMKPVIEALKACR